MKSNERKWTDGPLYGQEPVPGICKGLKRGVEGMRVGGTRTISVPPELGFGNAAVRSPYAVAWGSSNHVRSFARSTCHD